MTADPELPLAGMVWIPGGSATIGSETAYVRKLVAGRPPDIQKLFVYESPPFETALRSYYIGKYEVTNAQYLRFLESHAVTYDTSRGELDNLDAIAAHLVRLSKEQQKHPRQMVWRQLYLANKEAVWKACEERLDWLLVRRPGGVVDEELTARKFRFEPLPPTLKLKFYALRPPANWPDMQPPAAERDHPVRFVTYDDAEGFAEWAGAHLPTEYEWEWAARGPAQPVFPWGDDWPLDASRANWGGKVVDARYEITTLPVDGLPAGRSWCGCHHMVGNVAEWTSSWFDEYPNSPAGRHNKMGWVKVIRGGSAADGEMLVLRPTCRNYVGAGADAPPYPQNSFEWCGFRIAAYADPVRDRVGPVLRRATRHKKIKERILDLDRLAGEATRPWLASDIRRPNHVYARGRSHAVLVVPVRSFLRETGLSAMVRAWKRANGLKTIKDVVKLSERWPWHLGVLHTDVELEPVEVVASKPARKPGRRGPLAMPEVTEGSCPPGTYLLCLWFGRLALLDPSMEFVCFIPLRAKQEFPVLAEQTTQFGLKVIESGEARSSVFEVDAPMDWADLELQIPLGGKGVDSRLHLTVSARLLFDVGALEVAGFPD